MYEKQIDLSQEEERDSNNGQRKTRLSSLNKIEVQPSGSSSACRLYTTDAADEEEVVYSGAPHFTQK